MSILIYHTPKKMDEWYRHLSKAFPDVPIQKYPNLNAPEAIEFAVAWNAPEGLFDSLPNLKVIQSTGAGTNHVFKTLKKNRNIQVCRLTDPQLNTDMFEYILGIIIQDLRSFQNFADFQKDKKWKKVHYRNISDSTISFLGTGIIASNVASRLYNLGFKLKAWSRTKKEIEGVHCFAGESELETFLEKTDYLVSLLPANESTDDLINMKFLKKCPSNTLLINVGRGNIIHEKDLIIALDQGLIRKAVLDVFKQEPLPKEHPFWEHESIDITPHVASITNIESASYQVIENYKRFSNSENLLHLVSKEY